MTPEARGPAATPLSERLDRSLVWLSAYAVPLLIGLFSLVALMAWPDHYAGQPPQALDLRVVVDPQGDMVPAQAQEALREAPRLRTYDTDRDEHPFWWLLEVPQQAATTIEFPSRHATTLACFDAASGQPLGQADRGGQEGVLTPFKAGFALPVAAVGGTHVLCRGTFSGPARIAANLWNSGAMPVASERFYRNSGLLDGGLVVLAMFVLLAAIINRSTTYLLFSAWLVVNLRMASLSAGWDTQWLGQTVPVDWLANLRPITLALYYVLTVTLFANLFREDLERVGVGRLIAAIKWTCWPLLAAAVALPYALFLPVIWGFTGFGVVSLVLLLYRILQHSRSRVAMWYAVSIGIALFASLYEVIAAALGFKGLIGSVNSVTAALASSLMASLAIAEQIRLEHQQRLEAQAELEHTYEVMPIGLFSLDPGGRFLAANPALIDMLGHDVLALPGQDWMTLMGADNWQRLRGELAGGGSVEMEIEPTTDHQTPLTQGFPTRLLVKATLSRGKIEGSLQDVSEKARATEHLQFLANHDPLTRTLNRRGTEQAMERALTQLGQGEPMSLAYLDLDRFKLINDLYGHAAGDEVLQQVCGRVGQLLSGNMRLGRVGGDEFLIVMPGTRVALGEVIARAVVEGISAAPYQVGDRAFSVRGSIGLIEVSPDTTVKEAISTADRACREAKATQAHGLVVYELNSRKFQEHEAELRLVERLSNNEQIEGLFLEMQPIMSLRDPLASLNFEVLLRMHDAEGKRVPTERLIAAGEHSGRMGVIDRWVLTNTLEWLSTYGQELSNNQFVCLNLSGASLNDERFMHDVFTMLDQHRDIANRLCLEVTESVALHDLGNTRRFIERARSYGTKVALDDFGAGYTSFSYLKDLPADVLKIDGSFIVNMNQHPANVAIVEAIVSLAQNLGMKTIAEWAEDNETVETLAEIGVDFVQGFVVARPQTPARLLTVESSAGFIEDQELQDYVTHLVERRGGLPDVDLFLGSAAPASGSR